MHEINSQFVKFSMADRPHYGCRAILFCIWCLFFRHLQCNLWPV